MMIRLDRSQRRLRDRRRRPGVEPLESRQLLATVQELPVPTPNSNPFSIVAGPDGNLWFTELLTNKVGMISPDFPNSSLDFATPTANSGPNFIAAGPDGRLWFTEATANRIAAINPKTHVITEFPVPTKDAGLQGIAAGPDGRLWFTEATANQIGAIDPTTHAISEFAIRTANAGAFAITAGPDGHLWFTETSANRIGTIDPATHVISDFFISTRASQPMGIAAGPDGGVWFTEFGASAVGVINPLTHAVVEISDIATHSFGITAGPDGNIWFTDDGFFFGSGTLPFSKIWAIDPITHKIVDQPTIVTPTLDASPRGIVAGPDGNLWFVETTGQKIGVLTPTLVPTFTAPPPASIAPDTPFGVTVTVAYGSNFLVGPPDTHFHGLVELRIDSPDYTFGNTDVGGEGSPFAEAHDGVATFSGLTLRPSFPGKSTITLEAILAGRDDSRPAFAFVTVAPPSIVAQQALLSGAFRRVVGFWLEFDTAMDPASAANPANYSVVQLRRHGRKLIARPVAFRVEYVASMQRATLTLIGRPKFAAGGELVVHAAPPGGLVGAAGVPLDGGDQGVPGDDGTFAIAPRGKGLTRSAGPPPQKTKGA